MTTGNVYRKTLTEQVEEVFAKCIQGENVDTMLASLTPYEITLWEDMLTQFRKSADSHLLDQLKFADYTERPPTMQTFIEDPYYLGTLMNKSQDSEGMFPAWKEILVKDFNYGSAIHNCVITGSLGIGKCLCHNELCIMFDGSVKPVQNIKPGELLMGDDSTARKVLSVTKGRGKVYKIHPAKGEPFACNSAHVLCLKSSVSDEIEEVSVEDFIQWPRQRRHSARLYRTAVEWAAKPVTLDPYWLGLWLGDGNTHSPAITSADLEIIDYHRKYAKKHGLIINEIEDKRGNAAKLFSPVFKDKSKRKEGNPIALKLRAYGLCFPFEEKVDKFIPQKYLINSRAVRLQLLAGLLDTDGSKASSGKCRDGKTIKKNEGTYEITLKLERLADQVRFLAQSLGYFAQTKIKIVDSTAYFRTIISGAYDVPSLLTRKQSNEKGQAISPLTGHVRKSDCLKTKFAVIPLGEDDYYGFEIDGNHRFLLKDFTVTHNTFIMVTIILYRILIATLLRNPHNFFGLTKGTKIIFNLLSITKAAVTETAFGDIMNFMANSPYFLDQCGYNPDLQYTGFRIPLKGSLMLTAGSRGQHLLGRNIIGVGLDEGNWRLEAEPDTKAYELFNEVRNRINNRFRKVAGYLPAISILASSAKDESSFTEVIIAEINKANDPETQKVYRNSVYKIKRHTLGLGPRWFKVAYGLKNIPPAIMSGWYNEQGVPLLIDGIIQEGSPPGAKTELVPEMYFPEFRRRPLNALRDVCGISTGGVNRWFASTVDLERCVELAEKEGLKSPVQNGLELIPLSTEDSMQLWEYMDHRRFVTRVQSQAIPLRHPGSLRYAHIDLATTSMAGVAVCHLVGSQLVENLVKDGVPFNEYRLVVEYDFILTVIAGQVKPISLEKIQNFLMWLRQECGFMFGLVTYDQYQCLTGETLINTPRGLLPLREIVPGDSVQSRHGPEQVSNVYKYEQVPVLRITTNHGETICGTPNHRIEADLDPKPWKPLAWSWIRLDEITPGSAVHLCESPVEFDCADAELLPLDSPVYQAKSMLRFFYPGKLNPQLAELIGLFWGDGCIDAERSIRITVHSEDVAELCGIIEAFGTKPSVTKSKSKKAYQVALLCRRFSAWLLKNGFQKGTAKGKHGPPLTIPDKIMRSSRKVKAAFLRGLFSADGNVDKNDGTVSLSTCYLALAKQAMTLLRTDFGIKSTLVMNRRVGFGRKRTQYIIRLRGRRQDFAEKIGFCYRRKTISLAKHSHRKGRCLRERVVKIEKDTANVYDLNVANDHSYVANGFISHNSDQQLQMLEARGFKVDKQSVDRNKDAYIAWRMAAEELRLRPYRHNHMLWEAERLLDTDKKVDHPPEGCFTGDTRIALLDGTLPTFEELAVKYPNGEKFAVFSVNKDGICYAWAHHPRLTRRQAVLVEIVLDSFQVIRCTPDHLFMTLSREWIRAENLTPEIALMPLYRAREHKGGWSGYERAWCPVRNKRIPVHQLVAKQLFGELDESLVHHINGIKHNNDPANLELKSKSDHARDHTLQRHKEDAAYVRQLREGHKTYRLNGGNEKSKQNMLKLYETGVLKRGRKSCSIEECGQLADAKGLCGKHYQLQRRKAKGVRSSEQRNHRILSIRHLTEKSDVWDVTVDDTDTFFLSCGVSVHNSKDTTDACAGAYNNAINSEEKATMLTANNPRIHMNREMEAGIVTEKPLIEINLPPGYTRIRTFKM